MNTAFRIRRLTLGALAIPSFFAGMSTNTHAQAAKAKQPNILVIMADDVGIWNISAYHRGMMGGRTPNIDRIASQGGFYSRSDTLSYWSIESGFTGSQAGPAR